MKIFIDTADLAEIKDAFSWGIVEGITTNPSLMKKAQDKQGGTNLEEYVKKILVASRGTPVSLEVLGGTAEEMYAQGKKLYSKFKNYGAVVIKIPVNPSVDDNSKVHYEGLKATKMLSEENIPVNVTLVMTPEQALLAAIAGATYVSPFAGRIDDHLRKQRGKEFGKLDYFNKHGIKDSKGNLITDTGLVSGVHLINSIASIFRNYNFKTQILAASTRNARQVREIAEAGAHIATIPFPVLKEMIHHHKTLEGMKAFTDDIVPEYRKLFE
ncbi:MAG: transaldolase [Nanoarchaeota archaeon]|nr:transaldolase [Nanoarchaeota archaeon]